MPTADHAAQSTLALEVHRRLCDLYGCPVAFFHDHDPVSELVSALLSHRTRNAQSGQAFRNLRERFGTWEAVRDAAPVDVLDTVSTCTWPELKAPRVQQVLREVTRRRGGELSLDFLADMAMGDARAWLEELPGVGPKTSAATLLFSRLRMPAMPVDSHHFRVASRLGLVSAKTSEARAHAILAELLPADWPAQQIYDHHEVLMFHGQKCCYPAKPACDRCPLLDLCPAGQATRATGVAAAPAKPGRVPLPFPTGEPT